MLETTPEKAFAYLDDFKKLSAHMEESSMMMMGSSRGFGKWLGLLVGERYARWCLERIVQDAVKHFSGMRRSAR